MSKKDYIALARAINICKPEYNKSVDAHEVWNEVIEKISFVLGEDNDQFDYGRFETACREGVK